MEIPQSRSLKVSYEISSLCISIKFNHVHYNGVFQIVISVYLQMWAQK